MDEKKASKVQKQLKRKRDAEAKLKQNIRRKKPKTGLNSSSALTSLLQKPDPPSSQVNQPPTSEQDLGTHADQPLFGQQPASLVVPDTSLAVETDEIFSDNDETPTQAAASRKRQKPAAAATNSKKRAKSSKKAKAPVKPTRRSTRNSLPVSSSAGRTQDSDDDAANPQP